MAKFLPVVFTISMLVAICQGYPKGAPVGVCKTMTPKHDGIEGKLDDGPFEILADPKGNGQVDVQIKATLPNRPFKGFMLNAVTPDGKVTGAFTSFDIATTKALKCDAAEDTITHTSAKAKHELLATWNATAPGPVTFRATIVEGFSHFYVGIKSSPVDIQ